jgi:hypothetical protein
MDVLADFGQNGPGQWELTGHNVLIQITSLTISRPRIEESREILDSSQDMHIMLSWLVLL